ncbi:hypothetical protein GCM10029964_106480 [Kibdelosporangium lantanae]
MGERVVQLPRDVQPFLVGAAQRGLLTGAFGLVRPALGLAQRLPAAPAATSQASCRTSRARASASPTAKSCGEARIASGTPTSMSTDADTVTTRCPARKAAYTANRYATTGTSKPMAW